MKIKYGIIGLPNVGKSTLFNLITKSNVKNKNYPFCTIDPNYKDILIYNSKIKKISKILKIKNIKYPSIKFIDIAGLIKDSSKGYGLGNKFLNNIKNTNILIHVLRIFKNKNIINLYNKNSVSQNIKIINNELTLYDLNFLETMKKKKHNIYSNEYLNKIKKYIKQKKKNILNKEQIDYIKKINLISLKPQIYILNTDSNKNEKNNIIKKIKKYLLKKKKHFLIINIKNKNIKYKNIIKKIINLSFKLLKLKIFITIKNKKIQGWILNKKDNIENATLKIHTDFKKKLIKAEVINFKKICKYKKIDKIKKMGFIKYKGKKYIIKDGDIIKFII